MAYEQHRAREKYEAKREEACIHLAITFEQKYSCTKEAQSRHDYLPWWYVLVAWEGITTWGLIFTGFVIAWQSSETRRAAIATEDAVKAAETSYTLARDTSERELRAYLTVFNARLFLYDDGSIEPRLTISNSGQTPAYEFRGIQALTLDRTLAPPGRPSDDIFLRYGTVGKDYWLTGEMRKVGTTKQQVLDYLLSGDMQVILYGWYKYQDVLEIRIHLISDWLLVSGEPCLKGVTLKTNGWFFSTTGKRFQPSIGTKNARIQIRTLPIFPNR
jgi:hypothetical protein